jgi:hypothetical protein
MPIAILVERFPHLEGFILIVLKWRPRLCRYAGYNKPIPFGISKHEKGISGVYLYCFGRNKIMNSKDKYIPETDKHSKISESSLNSREIAVHLLYVVLFSYRQF